MITIQLKIEAVNPMNEELLEELLLLNGVSLAEGLDIYHADHVVGKIVEISNKVDGQVAK